MFRAVAAAVRRRLHLPSQATPSPPHAPYSHLSLPEVRVTALPGGLRVATQAYPLSTGMASVGVWVDAGTRYEAPGTNGAAHFLEHMIFKGTQRRTADSLEREIEDHGARLNAYTSREQTTFFADVRGEDVELGVDVLADILQNSQFPEKAIKREQGVILREMEEVLGNMEEVIFDNLHEAAYRGHPLGNTILGPEENIKSMTRAALENYISTHYTAPRMVISAAGAVKHDEVVNLVEKMFTKFPTNETTANQLVAETPAKFVGSEVRVHDDKMDVAHLAVAFEGAGWAHPDSIPLMVIQGLIGTWDKNAGVGTCSGSELARQISTHGLANSMMAFNTNYIDTGLVGIYVTSDGGSLYDLSCRIMEEFKRLATSVSESEVARARNLLKASLLLHIDGSTAVAESNGRQLLTYGRVVPLPELCARIDAVDASTVVEVAKKYLNNKDIAMAAIGPIEGLPEHSWFQSQAGNQEGFEARQVC